MTDITKCKGEIPREECPDKDRCYRYLVEPGEYQSYFMKAPFGKESCEKLWLVSKVPLERKRKGTTVRKYVVRICDACTSLEGEICNNPDCIFCRKSMVEVKRTLDALLIRPILTKPEAQPTERV